MIIYIFHIRLFAKIIKIILKASATVEYLNKREKISTHTVHSITCLWYTLKAMHHLFNGIFRHRHLYNIHVFPPWAIFL